MNKSEQAKMNIRSTIDIVNRSIFILKDFDALLENEGFIPTDPTRIECEPSKNINQNAHSSGRFFPLFMARYYVKENLDNTKSMLGVNIQFYHRDETIDLIPSLSTFLINWKHPHSEPKPEAWWLKYIIYESMERLDSIHFESNDYILDGRTYQFTPIKENKYFNDASFTFWGHELMEVTSTDYIKEKYITRLIELFYNHEEEIQTFL